MNLRNFLKISHRSPLSMVKNGIENRKLEWSRPQMPYNILHRWMTLCLPRSGSLPIYSAYQSVTRITVHLPKNNPCALTYSTKNSSNVPSSLIVFLLNHYYLDINMLFFCNLENKSFIMIPLPPYTVSITFLSFKEKLLAKAIYKALAGFAP